MDLYPSPLIPHSRTHRRKVLKYKEDRDILERIDELLEEMGTDGGGATPTTPVPFSPRPAEPPNPNKENY